MAAALAEMWAGGGEGGREVVDDANCTLRAVHVRPSTRRVGRFCLVSSRFAAREVNILNILSHFLSCIRWHILFILNSYEYTLHILANWKLKF